MKLNWFSPLPPERTDIAQYTVRVLEVLSKQAQVTAWTDQQNCDRAPAHNVVRFQRDRMDETPVQTGSINIYNIGNNSDFHAGIWEVSRRHPGVVILHDERLQHLFAGYLLGMRKDPGAYIDCMSRFYGSRGVDAASAYLTGEYSTDAIAEMCPLTQLALEGCLGVVVHNSSLYDRLVGEQFGPVLYAPLPYPSTSLSRRQAWAALRHRHAPAPARIAMFGYIGPNRRVESVIQALAGMNEKKAYRLDIYGTVWDVPRIRQLARAAGLEEQVHLHGFVANLDEALATADLVVNLRYPTMGEASGTQLRIWDHALPSVVIDVGWYSSLPSDAVIRIPIEDEVPALQTILRNLISTPERYKAIGEEGRAVLDRDHSPGQYAKAILTMAHEAGAFRSTRAALDLASRVGRQSAGWTNDRGVRGLISERVVSAIGDILHKHSTDEEHSRQ